MKFGAHDIPAEMAAPRDVAHADRLSVLYVHCRGMRFIDDARASTALSRLVEMEDWTSQVIALPQPSPSSRQITTLREWKGLFQEKMSFLARVTRALPKHDILHVVAGEVDTISRLALPAVALGRFFGKRVVLQFDEAGAEDFLDRWAWWFRSVLRTADALIAESRNMQRAVNRGQLQAETIVTPVNTEGFTHRVREKLQPKIMADCALEPDSNLSCLLDAFRYIKEKFPRAELNLIGAGSRRNDIIRKVNSMKLRGFEHHESPDLATRARLYDEADVFVCTATRQESPAALVRAFASGLPVVSTDADGLLHMVRNDFSALMVAVNDHVGIADQVISLVQNQELTRRLSVQGIQEARKRSPERVRQDWVNFYRRLMDHASK